MRIVTKRALKEFWERHPEAKEPLTGWMDRIEDATWKNTAELRASIGSADFVGDKTVFNVGGNKFRLIAFVHYPAQIVYVKHVLTHAEYDEGKWKS